MKFTVYHARHPTFGMKGVGPQPKFPEDYDEVAVVDADDLEMVFELTNHIDSPWHEGSKVLLLRVSDPRSTSVGDVVKTQDGMLFMCESEGWRYLKHEFDPEGGE